MKIILTFLLVLFTQSALSNEYCEVSLAHINPTINSKVENKDNTYIYSYTFKNSREALYSIKHIWIRSGNNSEAISAPEKWNIVKGEINNNKYIHSPSNYIRWSSELSSITPSHEATGFTIKSTQEPGIAIARVRARATAEKIKYTKIPSGKKVSCPGVWEVGASTEEDFIRVMTLGPSLPNTISLTSYVRPEGKDTWSGSIDDSQENLYPFPPLSKGNIEVLLVSNEKNSIDEIDTSSIIFGRGNAKPLSAKKIKIEKLKDFSNKINKNDINGKSALLLSFKSSDVNPLCDLDRALFLSAKMKSEKDLFSGVSIKNTECNQNNWANEAKKILEQRPEEGH